jgi:hypothetical protein
MFSIVMQAEFQLMSKTILLEPRLFLIENNFQIKDKEY